MEHLLLGLRKCDGTFTVFRRNLDGIFKVTFKEICIEHLLPVTRKWDGTFTVRYKELGLNIYC